jgi:hypothetical protein
MLNLKQLNAELEALKARKSAFPSIFFISTLLSYGHKLPLIGKIITKLSICYGKTTIWQILVKVRKAIVITNALIGVYAVLSISGFSYDNILAGFMGLGATYIEILHSLLNRLYSFFFNLFNNKVIPNVPTNSGSGWWWGPKQNTWYGKNMLGPDSTMGKMLDLSKSQSFYKGPFSTPNKWSLFNIDLDIPHLGVVYL